MPLQIKNYSIPQQPRPKRSFNNAIQCPMCQATVSMQDVGLRMYSQNGCVIPWDCRSKQVMQSYLNDGFQQAASAAEDMARTGDDQGFYNQVESLARELLD